MKLDEFRKLMEAATPANKPLTHSGIALDVSDADAAFIAAMRSMAPKMLAVCEAAVRYATLCEAYPRSESNHADGCSCAECALGIALSALEAPNE